MQVLRHDIGEKKKVGTISEAYPHLIINHFSSKLGQRVGNILKFLFPAPKVMSCALLALAPPHHAPVMQAEPFLLDTESYKHNKHELCSLSCMVSCNGDEPFEPLGLHAYSWRCLCCAG